MSRVRRGNRQLQRRKKILKQAKGYWGTKSKLYKAARGQLLKSLSYAYRDRRQKKRNFRSLWIIRIGAAARQRGVSYSQFIGALKMAGVELNRKMLADIAVQDPKGFDQLVQTARESLKSQGPSAQN